MTDFRADIDPRAIEVLRSLACEYNHQLKLFPAFVTPADELALLFSDLEDVYLPLTKGWKDISLDFTAAIKQLGECFDKLQGQPCGEAWSNDALMHSPNWANIRKSAYAALVSLGVSPEPPELNFLTYIADTRS